MKKHSLWIYFNSLILFLGACEEHCEPDFLEPVYALSVIGDWGFNQARRESCFDNGCDEIELDYFLGMKFTQDSAWFFLSINI